jgi:hypothetical protein
MVTHPVTHARTRRSPRSTRCAAGTGSPACRWSTRRPLVGIVTNRDLRFETDMRRRCAR